MKCKENWEEVEILKVAVSSGCSYEEGGRQGIGKTSNGRKVWLLQSHHEPQRQHHHSSSTTASW